MSILRTWSNLDAFCRAIKISQDDLFSLIRNQDKYIIITSVKKGTKEREIIKPKGRLEEVLKSIDREIKKFKLPFYFFGSGKGTNQISCAVQHLNDDFLLKIDLKRFYDNTRSSCQELCKFNFQAACLSV